MLHRGNVLVVLALVVGALALPSIQVQAAPPQLVARDATVALPRLDDGWWQSAPLALEGLTSLSAPVTHQQVQVRVTEPDGRWGAWQVLPVAGEDAPDVGSEEARGVRSELSAPVVLPASGHYQVRADVPGPLSLTLRVTEGSLGYRADADPPASAEAFSIWPPIVPRERWDPTGQCAATSPPRDGPSPERIFVHHTVIFPDHAQQEGDDVVRAMCAGHVARGFSDIGYHFLIDRFGTIYQGRAGGVMRPIVGAHAQGFNHGSLGIALIGNFEQAHPTAAAQESLQQLIAWLSDLHDIDPYGSGTTVSTGGDASGFAEGDHVELPNVVGHRDTGRNTACPGQHLYGLVTGPLRTDVRARLEGDYGWAAASGGPAPAGSRLIASADSDPAPLTAAHDPSAGTGPTLLGDLARRTIRDLAELGSLTVAATVASELWPTLMGSTPVASTARVQVDRDAAPKPATTHDQPQPAQKAQATDAGATLPKPPPRQTPGSVPGS